MHYINKVKVGDKEYNIGGIYIINSGYSVKQIIDQLPIDKEIETAFPVLMSWNYNGEARFGYITYSPDSEGYYFGITWYLPNYYREEVHAKTYEDLIDCPIGALRVIDLGSHAPSITNLLPGETYNLMYQGGQVKWVEQGSGPK